VEYAPFPITYWVSPPPELARYREVAECGFTVVPVLAETPAEGLRTLDLAQEVGVRAFVFDPRIHRDLPDESGWEGTIEAVVRDYGGHPALYGYLITDEPHLRHFKKLGQICDAFRALDPGHAPLINLFPNYASPDQLGTLDYRTHVRAFLETARPPLLSYDHYALMEWGDRPEYFPNLAVIREEAHRAGVPFWNIILSTPHFNYRDPSPADLRWQVYTTLCYGGKGLGYFTYWTLDVENYRSGIVDLYGYPTKKYAAVRQLNLELRHLGPHLLRLNSTRVSHWPGPPEGVPADLVPALDGSGLVASIEGGQYVVGEFVDPEGDPWLMVVNRDRERSAWTTLRLRAVHDAVSEVARSTGELRPISRDQGVMAEQRYADGLIVQFWLAPADGRLLRLHSAGSDGA